MSKTKNFGVPIPEGADVCAVIPAAGTGSRFHGSVPKQYEIVGDYPLIFHTIESIGRQPEVDAIVLVVDEPSVFVKLMNMFRTPACDKLAICRGEASRHRSIKAAIDLIAEEAKRGEPDVVLVHDGARPLVPTEKTSKLIDVARYWGAAGFYCPLVSTLLRLDGSDEDEENDLRINNGHEAKDEDDDLFDNIPGAHNWNSPRKPNNKKVEKRKIRRRNSDESGFGDDGLNGAVRVKKCVKRTEFVASETPQAFRWDVIYEAYNKCSRDDLDHGTECLDLVQKYTKAKPRVLPGSPADLFKVTYQKDVLSLAEMLARARV